MKKYIFTFLGIATTLLVACHHEEIVYDNQCYNCTVKSVMTGTGPTVGYIPPTYSAVITVCGSKERNDLLVRNGTTIYSDGTNTVTASQTATCIAR
ncbi:hypothetical protein [Spirosoma luteum]|uniref:hypothetical protein n=1 Tax=Spirosoma luteum TaxID=431553 RepID=UPI00038260F2|nr:hypothetical protein [Spirosoma luteum]